MQYGKETPDEEIVMEINAITDSLKGIVRPRFNYIMCDGKATLPEGFEVGKIITHQLKGSEGYVFFICTAGREFMEYHEIVKLEGDIFKIFIVDSIGSVIAEKCADIMELELEKELLSRQLYHTNRFSPGYCGWYVSQQQLLFPLFNGETCGVELTSSSLMIPIKSVSGIIGIGKDVRKLEYSCGLCDYAQCYKRKRQVLS